MEGSGGGFRAQSKAGALSREEKQVSVEGEGVVLPVAHREACHYSASFSCRLCPFKLPTIGASDSLALVYSQPVFLPGGTIKASATRGGGLGSAAAGGFPTWGHEERLPRPKGQSKSRSEPLDPRAGQASSTVLRCPCP